MPALSPIQLELLSLPVRATSHHQYRLPGQWIDYVLKRSKRRRSITLTIDEQGLRVCAPWRASMHRIESLIDAHASWIGRKLGEWQSRRPPPVSWQSGATIMVLGQALTLAPGQDASGSENGRLCIAADVCDPDAVAAQTIAWLRTKALSWFEQRVAYYAPMLSVRAPSVGLSNARTRWGACYPDGRIRLSWRLIQMPQALSDYVVVHELAHLREFNHSQRFWNWVASILPDHKMRRHALRKEGHLYLIA